MIMVRLISTWTRSRRTVDRIGIRICRCKETWRVQVWRFISRAGNLLRCTKRAAARAAELISFAVPVATDLAGNTGRIRWKFPSRSLSCLFSLLLRREFLCSIHRRGDWIRTVWLTQIALFQAAKEFIQIRIACRGLCRLRRNTWLLVAFVWHEWNTCCRNSSSAANAIGWKRQSYPLSLLVHRYRSQVDISMYARSAIRAGRLQCLHSPRSAGCAHGRRCQ